MPLCAGMEKPLRKSRFGVACTLDGYIAQKDDGIDWICSGEEAASAMTDLWKSIDAIVVGRKTYEFARKIGKPWPSFPGVKHYLCSRTLRAVSYTHLTLPTKA